MLLPPSRGIATAASFHRRLFHLQQPNQRTSRWAGHSCRLQAVCGKSHVRFTAHGIDGNESSFPTCDATQVGHRDVGKGVRRKGS